MNLCLVDLYTVTKCMFVATLEEGDNDTRTASIVVVSIMIMVE